MKLMTNRNLIGIDIGGTKIEGILWKQGKVVSAEKISTPRSRDKLVKSLFDLAAQLRAGGKINGVGLGIAGSLNIKTGTIYESPNLRFLENFNLGRVLQKQLGIKVLFDNDAKCFLRAEMVFGFARGKKNVAALTLGTGLGGAVLAEGNIVRGAHQGAAELSHMILYAEHGQVLNFEDLVSSHGFKRLGIDDPLDCQRRAFGGDKKALKIYKEIGQFLGLGLANIANVFDPELVVIGGGISRAGRLLMDPAKKAMRKFAVLKPRHLPQIRISRLVHPAALGATTLFLPLEGGG